VAQTVKERYSYLASDIVKEFAKHDEQPEKYVKTYIGTNPKTGTGFSCDVAYERFLGPELFFKPEIYNSKCRTPLPQVTHPTCLPQQEAIPGGGGGGPLGLRFGLACLVSHSGGKSFSASGCNRSL